MLTSLLERVAGDAFTVVDGVVWKKIHKFQAGRHASPEERNVLGVALSGLRARCDAVVFSRDRDRSVERQRDLEKGIRRARELFAHLEIVGGIAIENIEGWILVLLGVSRESLPPKKTKLELETRFHISTVREKVDVVAAASFDKLLPGSLTAWLETARSALVRNDSQDGA